MDPIQSHDSPEAEALSPVKERDVTQEEINLWEEFHLSLLVLKVEEGSVSEGRGFL